MRTLVEDDESIKTGRVRQSEQRGKGSVERKVVLMIWEMKRYVTFAAAISGTALRQLPKEGESLARGEGVGIALSPEGTKAWKMEANSGNQLVHE